MTFPKNKRRKIVVDGAAYEWCVNQGVLYYKHEIDTNQLAVLFDYGVAITPKIVTEAITQKKGKVLRPNTLTAHKAKYEQDQIKDRASLKLYVWTGVLTDWSSGVMFALAHNVKEAREKIKESFGYMSESDIQDLAKEPTQVLDKPAGFHLYGGS